MLAAVRDPGARHPILLAFGFYLLLGLLSAGWYAIRDPSGVCACDGRSDTAEYMWSLGWWPHALLHGLNLFVSHDVWYPVGANLTRSATIPTAAAVLWPVTALFGVVVSYNVMSIASPVLAAFTAYLLCRRIVGRELPALAGGFLFGFGAYQFAQVTEHPNLSLVFLVPVMVHLALRRVDREISARVYIVVLALVLVLQVGLSTEVLATALMLGLFLIAVAWALAPRTYRPRIARLLAETVAASGLAAVVTSPFLYYALLKGGMPREYSFISDRWGLDLLNPLVPTHATWLTINSLKSVGVAFDGGNIAEADGYLSLPIVLIFAVWVVRARRRLLARILLIAAIVSFVAALGSHLHVEHERLIELPYDWVRNVPVIRLITPARIIMYTSLALAIGVAAFLAEPPSRLGRRVALWLVFALGAVMILPNIGTRLWGFPTWNPALFQGTAYRRLLTPGEVVLVLPFGESGNSMLWQAETGFYFRMPEGYLGHLPPAQFASQPIVRLLASNKEVAPAQLATYLRTYHVQEILVEWTQYAVAPSARVLAKLGLNGFVVDGVQFYLVPAAVIESDMLRRNTGDSPLSPIRQQRRR